MSDNNILMVGNFSSGTGYAWNMINSCFYALGRAFIDKENEAYVCYPVVDKINDIFIDSNINILEFDFERYSFLKIYKFLKDKKIKNLYLINYSTFSPLYLVARFAGVRKIIVHDHASSGILLPNNILKKALKTVFNRIPVFNPDKILVISKFVKKRKVEGSCFPEGKIEVVYNGVDLDSFKGEASFDLHDRFNIPKDRKIVFCAARANTHKGIQFFIEASRLLIHEKNRTDLFFLYCGDGPDMKNFQKLVSECQLSEFFCFAGNSNHISEILKGVHVCVVPSVWLEGFGMMVIESMAAEVPVIASRVGGMAEIIDDGVDGIYVDPGDPNAIADAIENLVNDVQLKEKIKIKGKEKVAQVYSSDEQKQRIINSFFE
ncbi:glycosyltransferase family 4 protein [Geoalkalibacter halelectricus]|uniref:Glycosyltransferase family 4 protein n=1 Tax=Geoalkalibacter halelectricus TaxID=2847045 RepID=A0ABY5ZN15_9BACT|nr:glycosyltransferase family 4 protein [Geoalkalibacter halelectricus]MDO3379747.1 glycosyltransferase family 4 protein [Geoalkalibacter halelectricus]UWZ79280.1 glycosyltransferase family 4 protein [Geoalkalibacter halelectricus]